MRGLFQQGPIGSCLVTKITVKTCDFQECVPGKAQCSSLPYFEVCFEAWFFLLRGYKGCLSFAIINIQRLLLRSTNDTILQVSGPINHCFQKLKQSCLLSKPHLGSFQKSLQMNPLLDPASPLSSSLEQHFLFFL